MNIYFLEAELDARPDLSLKEKAKERWCRL